MYYYNTFPINRLTFGLVKTPRAIRSISFFSTKRESVLSIAVREPKVKKDSLVNNSPD